MDSLYHLFAGAIFSSANFSLASIRNFPMALCTDFMALLSVPIWMPSLSVAAICIFTILPLIFMICMAFTNYSKIGNHLMLFDWVGLDNFKALFESIERDQVRRGVLSTD